MAITQISQITVRKGLEQDLPQLAGGEFGWAIDTSNLYIGNGTLQEGAPAVGVTQVLTSGSSLVEGIINYRYQGPGDIPQRFTQSRLVSDKLQETVSVKDFGAVGDGQADDSQAFINALYQLYSYDRQFEGTTNNNSEAQSRLRKILFVPAGDYLISSAGNINIPSYCALSGEGANSSRLIMGNISLLMVSSSAADAANAVAQNILLQDIGLVSMGSNPLVKIGNERIAQAVDVRLNRVMITGTGAGIGVEIASPLAEANVQVSDVTAADCKFTNLQYGVYSEPSLSSNCGNISIRDSVFDAVGNGVYFANASGNTTGILVARNIFRNVAHNAQFYGVTANTIVSGENIHINIGGDPNPTEPVIDVAGNNFSSFGDVFNRTDLAAGTSPRIRLRSSYSVAMDGTQALSLRNRRLGGAQRILTVDTAISGPASIYTFQVSRENIINSTVTMDYLLKYNHYQRQGKVTWTTSSSVDDDTSGFVNEFTDNSDTPGAAADAAAISFNITTTAAIIDGSTGFPASGSNAVINYTCNVAGANLIYSIDSFNSQN